MTAVTLRGSPLVTPERTRLSVPSSDLGGAMRQVFSLQFPSIPGRDFAGILEEVGPWVVTFEKGQAVFGQESKGAYTEYVVAPAQTLALKPEEMSFDEAATIPLGATAAWQGLFDHGHLQPGQRVLIQTPPPHINKLLN